MHLSMQRTGRNLKTCSDLVLTQQEGQQHKHPPIVDDPPDIYVALRAGLTVAGKQGDVFGHQQGQVGCCSHPHCV